MDCHIHISYREVAASAPRTALQHPPQGTCSTEQNLCDTLTNALRDCFLLSINLSQINSVWSHIRESFLPLRMRLISYGEQKMTCEICRK